MSKSIRASRKLSNEHRANAEVTPLGHKEVPAFVKAHARRGTEDFGPDDLPWMGDKGDLDPDQLLKERGFDPLSALDYILLAIIDAHPPKPSPKCKTKVTRQARLEEARAALTGTLRRKRGMDEKDDYELLLRIGWQYHCLFWENGCSPPEVDPIAKACVEDLPLEDPRRRMAETSSVVARLRRKFIKDKDFYISLATEQRNINRMDRLIKLEGILVQMKDLGIAADRGVLSPLIVEPDAKSG